MNGIITYLNILQTAFFVQFFRLFSKEALAINIARDACPGGVCNTAFGNIDITNEATTIRDLITILIGIGGAISFVLIIYGVYILSISSGVPDKVNQGKELITSAVFGLLFCVLSLIIFRLVGVNILGIPGLI